MNRNLFFVTLFLMFIAANVYAQPNIFNSNDSIVLYNSSMPPATPPANTMAKWVKSTTRITWNTTKFKSYYWNGMVFRLRFPNNYDANDTTKKYPVILFFHGAGEIKPITDNEDQLYWGAQSFQGKIDAGNFNAFLLFPQVSKNSWDWFYQVKVNSVLDSMQKYCHSDPDKVIAMGLSNGAFAAMQYAFNFPTKVATVIASSPALIELLQETQNSTIHIPHWLASGGTDYSPGPEVMNNYVNAFTAKGGDIRFSFYPTLGHGTWDTQWNEPYLVPYWTAAHKANPLIFYKKSQFCPDAVTAHLGISAGFAEYQWQVNNTDIPGSNSNEIIGTQIGTYRARFRRIAGGDWSDWSLVPAVITTLPLTTSTSIQVTGTKSVVLPAPDGSTTVPLELPAGFAIYEWRRTSDNALVSSQRTFAAPVGQYKAKATNCTATYSPVFNVINATGTPKPDSARTVTLSRLSQTSIKLTWTEVTNPVSNETGFEIYRAPSAGGPYTLATITATNIKTYTDTSLDDNYNYYYIIRAVNATGASGLSKEISLQPINDNEGPSTPGNLKAAFTSRTYINLEWDSSTDNIGVTAYDVYVNNVIKYTSVVPKITVDSLTPNTSYTFKVSARDQIGNVSGASNVITARSVANGLKYRVYQGAWDVLPDFSALTPIATGNSANVDILTRPSGVNDNFGYVWEGFINIPTAGTYKFETISDDGSKLYYNTFYSPAASPLVNNDGLHAAITASGSITISDIGVHPIAITFFDRTGGESMQVYWTGPGIPRQLIPNAAFIESSTNRVPVSNAGADSTIILPVNSIVLSGSGTDSDGVVSTYAWTQVSGPNTATFSGKTVATPAVSGLVAGNYVFSLIVTDNELAVSVADQVTIKVTAGSLNQVPAADAGSDKSITLPANSTTLSGTGSDADGTIGAYSWTQVSGPDTATFSSKTVAAPTVSGLVAGIYVFSLIVTDNQLAVSVADQVTVTVSTAGSTPFYRINSGGAQLTNSIGVFAADAYYSPTPGNVASTTSAIAGTTDDAIYQSVRYGGAGTLNYSFPVTNGQYTVILHFSEVYLNNVGNRVFDVSLENTKVLDNYDIFKKAGANTATKEILSTNVTDGVLNIYFSSLVADGGTNSPMVSAIEIIRTSTNIAPVAHAP
ncbi:MAG: malectin domain-containing carbohydrate-binding protein, partial [Chitinophagaceae bacterium]